MLFQMRSFKLHFLLSVWKVSSPLQQIQVRGFRIPGTYPRDLKDYKRVYDEMKEQVKVFYQEQLNSSKWNDIKAISKQQLVELVLSTTGEKELKIREKLGSNQWMLNDPSLLQFLPSNLRWRTSASHLMSIAMRNNVSFSYSSLDKQEVSMKISWSENNNQGETFNCDPTSEISSTEIRSSPPEMRSTLVQLMRRLGKMPVERVILMKLLYHDDMTDLKDYERVYDEMKEQVKVFYQEQLNSSKWSDIKAISKQQLIELVLSTTGEKELQIREKLRSNQWILNDPSLLQFLPSNLRWRTSASHLMSIAMRNDKPITPLTSRMFDEQQNPKFFLMHHSLKEQEGSGSLL